MRIFRMLAGLLVLLCLVPPLVLSMAVLLGRWSGCELDPDVPYSCQMPGGDYGGMLQALTHFGYYAVGTLPISAALLIGWLVTEIVEAAGGRKKPPAPQTPASSRNRKRGS